LREEALPIISLGVRWGPHRVAIPSRSEYSLRSSVANHGFTLIPDSNWLWKFSQAQSEALSNERSVSFHLRYGVVYQIAHAHRASLGGSLADMSWTFVRRSHLTIRFLVHRNHHTSIIPSGLSNKSSTAYS
jgi:hypothetical protein